MTFDDDYVRRLDVLGQLGPLHELTVVDGSVEWLTRLEHIDTTIEQLPVDGLGTIEVVLAIDLTQLSSHLFLTQHLLIVLTVSTGATPHIASHRMVVIDETEKVRRDLIVLAELLLEHVRDSRFAGGRSTADSNHVRLLLAALDGRITFKLSCDLRREEALVRLVSHQRVVLAKM